MEAIGRVYGLGEVGNPTASPPKSNDKGIPALRVLNPVSNFLGFSTGLLRGLGLWFEVCGLWTFGFTGLWFGGPCVAPT